MGRKKERVFEDDIAGADEALWNYEVKRYFLSVMTDTRVPFEIMHLGLLGLFDMSIAI